MMLKTDRMIAHKDGAIGWITFNNPARHNAVSMSMWESVPRALAAVPALPRNAMGKVVKPEVAALFKSG